VCFTEVQGFICKEKFYPAVLPVFEKNFNQAFQVSCFFSDYRFNYLYSFGIVNRPAVIGIYQAEIPEFGSLVEIGYSRGGVF